MAGVIMRARHTRRDRQGATISAGRRLDQERYRDRFGATTSSLATARTPQTCRVVFSAIHFSRSALMQSEGSKPRGCRRDHGPHRRAINDGATGLDVHIECRRLEAGCPELDVVRSRRQTHMLG
jgi:hypothetical protein